MRRVLSMQDLSCLGQCSLGVSLPVLSACGCECAVLPTAYLSTHTGAEFTRPYIAAPSPYLAPTLDHWREMGITFDGILIGYLGHESLIAEAIEVIDTLSRRDTAVVVDPAMGDGGRFYSGMDEGYAAGMRALCAKADILLPNLTEAALLLGERPPEEYDLNRCLELARGLCQRGAKTVVLTGLELRPCQYTNLVCTGDGQYFQLNHVRHAGSYHGTGDLFASAVLGRLMRGDVLTQAVYRAGKFVSAAIARTPGEKAYGTCFEECLHLLWEDAQ